MNAAATSPASRPEASEPHLRRALAALWAFVGMAVLACVVGVIAALPLERSAAYVGAAALFAVLNALVGICSRVMLLRGLALGGAFLAFWCVLLFLQAGQAVMAASRAADMRVDGPAIVVIGLFSLAWLALVVAAAEALRARHELRTRRARVLLGLRASR